MEKRKQDRVIDPKTNLKYYLGQSKADVVCHTSSKKNKDMLLCGM